MLALLCLELTKLSRVKRTCGKVVAEVGYPTKGGKYRSGGSLNSRVH